MHINVMTTMNRTILPVLFTVIFFCSCGKSDSPVTPAPNPCAGLNYTVEYFKTEAIGTSNNGTIIINSPVGDTVTYKLGTGAYQTSNSFSNLAPGNYVITIKNHKNCTDTAQITILNYGPKYAQVKMLIAGSNGIGGYCGPCHLNGGMDGNKNFDTDASIIASWDRIKARAVDNNPTQMPALPNFPLSTADKQKITDWVNAGHRISD
jgi:hypothetical protein